MTRPRITRLPREPLGTGVAHAGIGSFAQPEISSQLSAVQTLSSSQSRSAPASQMPVMHMSQSLQASPSSQEDASGAKASGPQVALDPVQNSVRSHTPAEARHSVVAGPKTSAGQLSPAPSQALAPHTYADAGGPRRKAPSTSS